MKHTCMNEAREVVYRLNRSNGADFRPETPRAGTCDEGLPEKRRLEMLHFLRVQGQATIDELAERWQVSCATVRRDLDRLASQKLITRTYGGAIVAEDPPLPALASGQRRHLPESHIARAACRLIAEGETLLVSGGLFTKLIASELIQKHLTIITNDLTLPAAVPTNLGVYVLGGKYARDAQTTVGPIAVSGAGITVDSALISIDGVTAETGLSMALLEEAWMVSAMMAAARRTIVLASGAKLGKAALARAGGLDNMQVLVTDQSPPVDLARALQESRVQVIVAPDH